MHLLMISYKIIDMWGKFKYIILSLKRFKVCKLFFTYITILSKILILIIKHS